jgi:hypothetical protein
LFCGLSFFSLLVLRDGVHDKVSQRDQVIFCHVGLRDIPGRATKRSAEIHLDSESGDEEKGADSEDNKKNLFGDEGSKETFVFERCERRRERPCRRLTIINRS